MLFLLNFFCGIDGSTSSWIGLEQLKSKQEITQRSLWLSIIYSNKHMSDNPDYRYTFLKWILHNFKEFICSLQLKLCGDELFLLNPGLKFPNLEELSLSAFHKSGMFIFTRDGNPNPGSGISQFFINYQKSGIRNFSVGFRFCKFGFRIRRIWIRNSKNQQ